ncbi:dihydrolipoamide acetyltransferase family protein [Salinisphaera sp.]|uniref:dihydrolipoamide acetyltransferase family protein n=1 Tax=Salinisphaera sp. TaxID=1914330 RepID=UPI002D774506|nr:dihydrolipoamide acetyltransferase family protein [Salinisphaera sp.]HET7315391.1 dihydrolipoamide acetyltransferase family protein [Salinisphaera sp.]
MSQEFKFSDPGEGLQEAEILEVHVSEGDTVNDGDTVLTVETDKANTDVPAPFSGTVEEVRVSEGDMVEVGDVLLTYDEGGESGGEEESEDSKEQASESEESGEDKQAKEDRDEEDEESDKEQEKEKQESGKKQDRDKSDKNKDDKDKGDKKEQDKDEEEKSESSEEESSEDKQESKKQESSREPVPAAPSTRRLAREKGVDLHDIEPSGKDGRVTAEDVEAAAGSAEREQESREQESREQDSREQDSREQDGKKRKSAGGGSALIPGAGEAPSLPDFSQWGEIERAPLRSIRRATAQNMARSWGQIPHVYHQDIADVTELERFRRSHEEAAQAQRGKFTLTVLMMKALVSTLKQFPRFNASLDVENQEIVLKRYFHIGLAVATDRGLLVPVIRDVDQKNLIELSAEALDIARKTRNGEIKREDMMGGSMTVTNPGAMGGSSLTPLINHPQVAILGMGQARLEPVVHGDLDAYEVKPRLRLPLILGFDHRVNDGADAAQFVTTLIRTLADPESLLLNI